MNDNKLLINLPKIGVSFSELFNPFYDMCSRINK